MFSTKVILVIVLLLSLILYFSGLYTGVRFSKEIERMTSFKIDDLSSEINDLNNKIKSANLFGDFMDSLDDDVFCSFSHHYIDFMIKDLEFYWDVLPYRLEEFELNNVLSDDYLALKRDYTQALLYSWMNINEIKDRCSLDIINIIYFYSSDCYDCVEQGRNLDEFKTLVADLDFDIIIYTIDFYQEEPVLDLIKDYYNLTSVPSLVLKETVFNGEFTSAQDLLDFVLNDLEVNSK
ncbi:MAG: hypothetical protein ACMXX7_00105 [Candidatus Woesearchaeota archaeon]